MGRYVRAVIRGLATRADIRLTLLVRDPGNTAAYREICGTADIAPVAAANGRAAFAAVWYPWNGMRFPTRAPALVTINDDFAFRYPAREIVARWREQRPIRRAIERARQLITISAWARDTLIERFALDPARIGIIPLTPDPFFAPGDADSPFTQPFVLAVGSGEARKNIGFLIEVFGRAFPNREARLVIVGSLDPALRKRVQSAGLALSELSNVDDLRLRDLYRRCAAVAVPSLAEGFGLVAIEAQACGAPVIAADTSALPEAVGGAAILLAPDDDSGWAAALRDLVTKPALNAYYREQSLRRWPASSADGTTDAVRAALERAIHDLR